MNPQLLLIGLLYILDEVSTAGALAYAITEPNPTNLYIATVKIQTTVSEIKTFKIRRNFKLDDPY